MPITWGTRSARDAETWTCSSGYENPPERHYFFAIPKFTCGCLCGEEYAGDFEFCLGDIKVNGDKLLGDMPNEGITGECVQHAFAKQMEITKRVKAILQKKDPNSIPKMSAEDLVNKYEAMVGKLKYDAVREVVHTALIVKEQGIQSMGSVESTVTYKASNVSVIRRNEYKKIAAYLADGFPLHAGILVGRRLRRLRFCRRYKSPRLGDFSRAKRVRISAHAVLLVGAGRKGGKWYFFFLNSWYRFCCRFNASGKKIGDGIGKIAAERLFRNVVRLSRFKEENSDASLLHQDVNEVSEHNNQLMVVVS